MRLEDILTIKSDIKLECTKNSGLDGKTFTLNSSLCAGILIFESALASI